MADSSSSRSDTALGPDRRRRSRDHKIGVETLAAASGPSSVEAAFGDLIPAQMVDPDRTKFLTGLAIGVQVMRLDGDVLRQRIEHVRETVAMERGREDPKIDRLAALRFAREIRNEAVGGGRDPLEGLEQADARKKYDAAVRHAMGAEMNWRSKDVRAATVDLIVKFDGDREKAAHAFYELVRGDRRIEAGHASNTGIEIESGGGRGTREIAEMTAPEPMSAGELKAREKREERVDQTLVGIDKVAAAILGDKEYAGYRLLRDNAHLVHLSRSEVVLAGDERDNTPGKLIADRLNTSLRNGRHYAATIIEKLSAGQKQLGLGVENRDLYIQPGEPRPQAGDTVAGYLEKLGAFSSRVHYRRSSTTEHLVERARSRKSTERTDESRERERVKTRERARLQYERKKARRQAEMSGIGL